MKTWIAKIKDSGPWIVFFEIFVIAQLLLPVYTWTRFRDYSREYFLRDYPQHFFSLRHC